MVREGQRVTYGEKLGELGLFRCKRRYGEILMLSAMGRHREDGARIFLEMHCSRDNRREVAREQFGCGMGKAPLSLQESSKIEIKSRKTRKSLFLELFMTLLDKAINNLL